MPKKPTAADAQLILQLYDLRREAEMRKARAWVAGFWPQNADQVNEIANAFGKQENTWLRQVTGYWEMAAALVLQGTLNEDLFFETTGEMWFVFSKFAPFIGELRKKSGIPQLMLKIEKLATKSKAGRDRLKQLEARFAPLRAAAAKA